MEVEVKPSPHMVTKSKKLNKVAEVEVEQSEDSRNYA